LIGNFEVCADCAKAKAQQRNRPKGNNTVHAKHNGERLFMDISSIKTTSYGGSKYWLLVVDDKTDYLWSYFLKHKSETKYKICALVLELKTKNALNVLFIF
jgi:transposase InsO family protein